MVNIVVAGATGKLGRMVCDQIVSSDDLKLTGAIVSENGGNIGRELYPGIFASAPSELETLLKDADVYVDFTAPAVASAVVDRIAETGTNLVLGTTAVDASALNRMTENTEKYGTSAIISSNFASGVNIFWKICEILAKALPEYDIEVVEAHHGAKKDSPSGTALETVRRLSNATGIQDVVHGREGITGPRKREIGVHSIRAGNIVGDHTVIFAGDMERIEFSHKAVSREVIAMGCVKAIRWISDKKDGKVHSMEEVLNL